MISEAFNSLLNSDLLSGAALLSLFGSVAFYLKDIPTLIWKRIKRMVVYTVTIESTDNLFIALEQWLYANHSSQYRNTIATMEKFKIWMPNDYRQSNAPEIIQSQVFYRQETDLIVLKNNRRRIFVSKGRTKLDQAKDIFSMHLDMFVLTSLFSSKPIVDLLNEISNEYSIIEAIKINGVRVLTHSKHDEWLYRPDIIECKSYSDIYLDPTVMQTLLNDLNLFIDSKDWYTSLGIAYKKGYLFYGVAGSGKSTLAMAIAKYLNRRIYVLNLLKVVDLAMLINDIEPNSILLIEDIDASFTQRQSHNKDLSFSDFLQYLDGILYVQGLIVIMTTNHIENLDPALIRPGRIDFRLEFKNPTYSEASRYMQAFYKQPESFEFEQDPSHRLAMPMSGVQNVCLNNSLDKSLKIIFGLTY